MRCGGVRRPILLAILVISVPSVAWSWGSDGHHAIGEIAMHYLSPEAELGVGELLEPGRYGTLAAAGYWADAHARLYSAYDAYLHQHYVNVDPESDSIDLARDCPEGCVLSAIATLSERLRDTGRPRWERAQDLRFLVHFVEDVHQPLHVVHPDARGGNRTAVAVFGEEMNLHQAWDWGLIEHRLEEFESAAGRSSWSIPPWKQWAYDLRLLIDVEDLAAWSAQTDPLMWATEGIEPARRLTFDVTSGEPLGDAYYDAALPVIEQRIQMAAVRLATLLNDIFSEE